MSAFATAVTWPRPSLSDGELGLYKRLSGGKLERLPVTEATRRRILAAGMQTLPYRCPEGLSGRRPGQILQVQCN